MVIQTGEEGRHRLRLPDTSSPASIERFVAEAQAHLEQVFGRPLPRCLVHGHALRGVVESGQVWWVCRDGQWRCLLGGYDDLNWPPAVDERPGSVVQALTKRFARRGIWGWQSASPSAQAGPWSIRISVWPMDQSVIEQMRRAADPVVLDVECGSPPPTREDDQRGIDRAHEHDVRWARWAVQCWADFPVARHPRPLVFVEPRARPEHGFRSGTAKLGFIHGLIESAVPLPGRILAALGARTPRSAPIAGATPVVITAARQAEAVFRTDRGPKTLPAWQLEADDVNGSIWVTDPEPIPAWEPERPPRIPPPFSGSPHRSIRAVLAADQRTLTVSFVGAPASRMSYSGGAIIQSDTAVAIVPQATSVGRLARWHTAVGMQREITVRLDGPLGERVLIDLDGTPAEVLIDCPPDDSRPGEAADANRLPPFRPPESDFPRRATE
jgi:hypothetical protein